MTWGVANYSTTPALNTAINGVDISEGCEAAGYNDALRQIMADIATWTAAYAVTYPISIANGGTGQTTASAALAALGGLSSSYQRLPQVAKSAAFSFSTDMDGGHVRYTGAAAAATINPNATTAFPRDAVILVVNDGSGALTITRGTGVALIWASSGADANRSLAVGGMAAILQVATDRWFISGAGLS
jgi:hypothetical protein